MSHYILSRSIRIFEISNIAPTIMSLSHSLLSHSIHPPVWFSRPKISNSFLLPKELKWPVLRNGKDIIFFGKKKKAAAYLSTNSWLIFFNLSEHSGSYLKRCHISGLFFKFTQDTLSSEKSFLNWFKTLSGEKIFLVKLWSIQTYFRIRVNRIRALTDFNPKVIADFTISTDKA